MVLIPGGKIDVLINPDFNGFEGNLRKGLSSASGVAKTAAIGLGAAITAGTALAAVGFKKVIDLGIQYQDNLNELQAVSGATGAQMSQISKVAVQLGNDLSLPSTSAADAASAMLELTKGGLSVSQAMTAAKGTLQLAAAASIDAGTAAEIQSKALNEFGLSADSAGHVADVLANTANAAAGSITDIGYALNYVGPVAKSFGISIDDTATALGLMANKGIQGEQAGTSLRGVLASLASPSKQAAAALSELGVKAFDNKGKFVGLEAVVGQLAKAHGKLSQAQFEQAAATAVGNEGLTVANALAESGTAAFDDMAKSVSKQGGAADVAAAKMKGLGGAVQGFQSQAETIGIDIYQKVSPGLEALVRAGTTILGQLDGVVTNALDDVIAGATAFGPSILKAVHEKADNIRDAGVELLGPLVKGAEDAALRIVGTVTNLSGDISKVAGNVIDGLKPVADATGNVVKSLDQSGGPLATASTGLEGLGAAAGAASALLKPVGEVVGGLVNLIAGLPGPVQSAVVGLVAFKLAQKALGDTSIPVISGIKQFRDEMQLAQAKVQTLGTMFQGSQTTTKQYGQDLAEVGLHGGETAQSLTTTQRAMAAFETSTIPAVAAARDFRDQTVAIRDGAAAAGAPISTMSAALGTLVERSPMLSAMRASFDTASQGAERFGTVAGIAAAAGTGLKGAAGALVGALGGPLGLAIGAVSVGLSILASRQEDAAAAAQRNQTYVDSLASSLRDSNGVITENIRLQTAQQFLGDDYKVAAAAAKTLHVSLSDITDAALNQGDALGNLKTRLEGVIAAHTQHQDVEADAAAGIQNTSDIIDEQGTAAQNLLDTIIKLSGGTDNATKKNQDLADAVKDGSTPAMKDFTAAMSNISKNGSDADTVLRNLKDAFDALTGKQIDVQQATADFNQVIASLGEQFKDTADKSKGFHDSLITGDDAVNVATDNGRKLLSGLNDTKNAMDKVAKAAFDASQAQGDDLATSSKKAEDAAKGARDQFLDFATNTLHLTAQEAAGLADKFGLIPKLVATQISTPGMSLAQAQLIQLKQQFDDQPDAKNIRVTAPTDEAVQNLRNLGFTVTSVPGSKDVIVSASTQGAIDALNNYINNNNNRTVNVKVHLYSDGSAVQITPGGGRVAATLAAGGLLDFYAAGGLRPMKGGYASIVRPDTWRVIGDNMQDPEAYIPINRSLRSQALLNETASRMGYALIRRYAGGGIASNGSAATSVPPTRGASTTTINNTINAVPGQSAQEIGRIASDRIAWDLRRR